MSLRRITSAVLIITIAGCTTVRPVASPRDFLNSRQPGRVWVSGVAPSEIEVSSPKVLADTVFGFDQKGEAITLPIASITQLRASRVHVGRTAALSLLFLAGAAVAIATFQGISGEGDPDIPEDARPRLQLRIPF
jgi:hypothetical protein